MQGVVSGSGQVTGLEAPRVRNCRIGDVESAGCGLEMPAVLREEDG